MSLIAFLARGGVLLVPILLLSAVAVYVIVERGLYYWRIREPHPHLSQLVREQLRTTTLAAVEATLTQNHSLEAQLARASLAYRNLDEEEYGRMIELVTARQLEALEHNVGYLQSIASIATLVGLLGTVVGMIRSFVNMASGPVADMTGLSGGIAQALITTAAGLGVAIPSLLAYHLYVQFVHHTVARLNIAVAELGAYWASRRRARRAVR